MGRGATNKKWMKYRENQLALPIILPVHQEAAYGMAKLALMGFNKTQN